jgi:hypothetical protein
MRATGDILQWSNDAKRGTIHLGGGSHAALLSFAHADCDRKLKDQLRAGDVPPGASVSVRFDIALRKGALAGINVRPAGRKSSPRKAGTRRAKSRRSR